MVAARERVRIKEGRKEVRGEVGEASPGVAAGEPLGDRPVKGELGRGMCVGRAERAECDMLRLRLSPSLSAGSGVLGKEAGAATKGVGWAEDERLAWACCRMRERVLVANAGALRMWRSVCGRWGRGAGKKKISWMCLGSSGG